jgi:hypothetical protein
MNGYKVGNGKYVKIDLYKAVQKVIENLVK